MTLTVHDVSATRHVPFEVPPVVLPHRCATLSPAADLINLSDTRRTFTLQVDAISPTTAVVGLDLPQGWTFTQTDDDLVVTVPDDVQSGVYTAVLTLDGQRADSVQHIQRSHTAPRVLVRPAIAQIRVVDAALPQVTVGYIGGGNDQVGHWLDRMGLAVTDLSDAPLSDKVLAQFDTLVVGIFALKFRAGLANALPRIHDWVRAGARWSRSTIVHGTTGTRINLRPSGWKLASHRCAGASRTKPHLSLFLPRTTLC